MKTSKFYFLEMILNFFITFLIGGGQIILNKYFAYYLGDDNLGIMKLFTQLLSYLNLADMGVAAASTYALYKPLANKDYKEISVIMNTITRMYNKILIYVLGIGLLVTPTITFFINNTDILKTDIYLYWVLYVLGLVVTYRFLKFHILFLADQKFKLVKISQGFTKILIQLLQIYVLIKFKSFYLFIILIILEGVIQYILFKYLYNKNYANHILKTLEIKKEIIKNLKKLFWHKLAGMVVFNTDLIIISKFISLKVVAIYSSYLLLEEILITIITIFTSVLAPKIGKYIAFNEKNKIYESWKSINNIFLFIGIFLTFSMYKLSSSFVTLWMGEDFLLPKMTLFLICINIFIRGTKPVIESFKNGSGFFDDIHLPIAEAIINFIFSIVLVYYIGLNGVILGTVVSNITIICIAKPLLVFKKCFDKGTKDYLKIYGLYLIFSVIAFYICNILFKLFFEKALVNNWLDWFILSIKSSVLNMIILFVIYIIHRKIQRIINT